MSASLLSKITFPFIKLLSNPRSSMSWVRRGHLVKDRAIVSQTYWHTGTLPRVPLAELLPDSKSTEVCLPRAFDRRFGTSITVEEACHLGTIVRCLKARNVLEIGTFDGNTALLLAANLEPQGVVVTVDLPPDFDLKKPQASLVYADGEINLTPRDQLGRQYRNHPLSSQIRQVYGDSASLDWKKFGGPFDLIFIDGCHTEDYVRSDSRNAVENLRPGGAIVWHDYGMIPDVSLVVDQIARESSVLKVNAIEGTRLVLGLKTS